MASAAAAANSRHSRPARCAQRCTVPVDSSRQATRRGTGAPTQQSTSLGPPRRSGVQCQRGVGRVRQRLGGGGPPTLLTRRPTLEIVRDRSRRSFEIARDRSRSRSHGKTPRDCVRPARLSGRSGPRASNHEGWAAQEGGGRGRPCRARIADGTLKTGQGAAMAASPSLVRWRRRRREALCLIVCLPLALVPGHVVPPPVIISDAFSESGRNP